MVNDFRLSAYFQLMGRQRMIFTLLDFFRDRLYWSIIIEWRVRKRIDREDDDKTKTSKIPVPNRTLACPQK